MVCRMLSDKTRVGIEQQLMHKACCVYVHSTKNVKYYDLFFLQ